ncbi:metal ABC transporter solute-binding protein, Zn/Mn family [Crocinitomix catalasitica]|uniref:metal ABC transporter solute-binding protein, Zn/Mn family n=1 Tax=Crocinitomix catalasitica TaxID=184607 RepID=UPI000480605D|nr:zinc ABC transporter substrate-binding protein [Crocinitomix catalasitica]
MKNIFIFILIIGGLNACRIEESTQTGPLNIVVTTGIIKDGLYQILGDNVEITSMMGPGTDPHLYKPTPGDVDLLENADIIIANGLHLEGKMSEMLRKYGQEKLVLNVADGIDKGDLIKSADFEDSFDPHIWFDPTIWINGLEHVKNGIAAVDTANKSTYDANFNAYKKEVLMMDSWAKEELGKLHEAHRILITSHDAFSYFGRRYGVEVKGIQGISTLSEVGLRDIADMVDFVITKGIKSIFIETSTSSKTAQSILDGAEQKKYLLKIDGPLFSDALGEPDTKGGTYIGMFKENVEIIVNGLK